MPPDSNLGIGDARTRCEREGSLLISEQLRSAPWRFTKAYILNARGPAGEAGEAVEPAVYVRTCR